MVWKPCLIILIGSLNTSKRRKNKKLAYHLEGILMDSTNTGTVQPHQVAEISLWTGVPWFPHGKWSQGVPSGKHPTKTIWKITFFFWGVIQLFLWPCFNRLNCQRVRASQFFTVWEPAFLRQIIRDSKTSISDLKRSETVGACSTCWFCWFHLFE